MARTFAHQALPAILVRHPNSCRCCNCTTAEPNYCFWSSLFWHRQQICYPDSKVHGANMGPIWGWQGPGGHHVGPMNLAIWEVDVLVNLSFKTVLWNTNQNASTIKIYILFSCLLQSLNHFIKVLMHWHYLSWQLNNVYVTEFMFTSHCKLIL